MPSRSQRLSTLTVSLIGVLAAAACGDSPARPTGPDPIPQLSSPTSTLPPAVKVLGPYTLRVTATRCTAPFPGSSEPRVYNARVDHSGNQLRVTLTGADFLPGAGAFSGEETATGAIRFEVKPVSIWGYDIPDMEERLSDGTILATFGIITATVTPEGICGQALNQDGGSGGILHLPPRSPWVPYSWAQATSSCYIDRFDLVPVPGS
jgi:hypothetical protein